VFAAQLKRRLSTARLSAALESSGDARAVDRSHGVRGLPLLSLEELMCVVLLACRRPQVRPATISGTRLLVPQASYCIRDQVGRILRA
jgi:hypothetical protein